VDEVLEVGKAQGKREIVLGREAEARLLLRRASSLVPVLEGARRGGAGRLLLLRSFLGHAALFARQQARWKPPTPYAPSSSSADCTSPSAVSDRVEQRGAHVGSSEVVRSIRRAQVRGRRDERRDGGDAERARWLVPAHASRPERADQASGRLRTG